MDNILSTEQSTISSQGLCKYGYIYVTTNLINGKKYIGAHKSSCFDETYKGSGKILWKAINKYGWENFDTKILKWCYSKDELFLEERLEIESRDAVNSKDYYNVMVGGHGGNNKTTLSPEDHDIFVQKIRNSKINRPRTEKEIAHMKQLHLSQKGKPHSEESKQKSRISNLGQTRSEETKKHLSENHADFSGEKNPFYGKIHTEESKSKISQNNAKAHKGKVWITNKTDDEVLIPLTEINQYEGYVRGRLRKSQRRQGSTTIRKE